MHIEPAARDRLTDLNRVAGRRIEGRIHEIEMTDARFRLELFDLFGDELWIAGTVPPAFDVAVGAIDAFVHASPLGLNRNRGAVPLVARQIDPAVQRWRGQGVEIRVFAG